MTRNVFDAVGLSASRTAWLHLVLICVPFRFGLQPLALEISEYVPINVIGSAGSIFESSNCSEVELFLIRDFGSRLMLYQSLAWIVWLVMRQSTANLKAFHKLLIATSLGNLLAICWEQNIFHPAPPDKPLNHNLFREILGCYGIAILLSSWTTLVYSKPPLEAMKWSIPGNAIYWGGIINLLTAVATLQAVFKDGGIEQYFRDKNDVTERVRVVFVLSACYTLAHATLLIRIRAFLTMPQLRKVCLYKIFISAALPLTWLPEMEPTPLVVDKRLTLCIRISVFLTYVGGYLWAGQAEGFSSILSGEKDD
uniref:Uncharacterized protein n=1 Tax=Amphora coffeiformis TaxID=265554 RepID=A0A7S3P947_9STRA|mmetsp:Transcript_6322/g.12654  ORF Transcript_6322/g.12654 Transcript_6322/m.12654 type:complete len:310 (+) Transcript_6322:84-1013(+)